MAYTYYCSMNLYFLIYRGTPTVNLSDEEIEALLVKARRENQAHEVTGMLLCFPKMYIQLIEGPEEKIRQLYKNIQNDKRHNNVHILKEGYEEKRFFPKWAMGFDKQNKLIIDDEGSFDITESQAISLFEILNDRFK